MQIIDVIDDDSNSNVTATGERKEVAFLTNKIKLEEQSLKEAEERSLQNKVEDYLPFINSKGREGWENDSSKSSSVSLSESGRLGGNRNGQDESRSAGQDTCDTGEMRRQPSVPYPSSSQGVPHTLPVPHPGPSGPSRQSLSGLSSEVPPPNPPDTPSSSQHPSQYPSQLHIPRRPHAPGGPDTTAGTPAPPPPPTLTHLREHQNYTRANPSMNNYVNGSSHSSSSSSSSHSSSSSSSSMDDVNVDLPPSLLGSNDTDDPDHRKRRRFES